MNEIKIRCFVVLAETLNYTEAAEILFMSQPNLSRVITGMENELGVRLFIRNHQMVYLTNEGLALLPLARSFLDTSDQMVQMANNMSRDLSRELCIGLSGYSNLKVFDEAVRKCRELDSRIAFSFIRGDQSSIAEALNKRRADVCFGEYNMMHLCPTAECIEISAAPYCAVVSEKHPLAKYDGFIPGSLLKDERIFTVHSNAKDIFPPFRDFGLSSLSHIGSLSQIVALVRNDLGIAILHETLQDFVRMEGICFRPIDHAARYRAAILWLPDNTNRVLNIFLQYFRRLEPNCES